MTKQKFDRRDILRGAVVGGAAAASATGGIAQPQNAHAQQPMAAPLASDAVGYAFLNLEEAAFVEALVDHMVPADDLTPKGTDIGINIYIDRALPALGQGRPALLAGAVEARRAEPGLPVTDDARATLSRRIEATNAHCRKTYGKTFDLLDVRGARKCWSASRPPKSSSTMPCRCACSGPRFIRP